MAEGLVIGQANQKEMQKLAMVRHQAKMVNIGKSALAQIQTKNALGAFHADIRR